MSVLDPDHHRRLIEELDDVARVAGVPKRYIERSMSEHCSAEEAAWVRDYRLHAAKGQFGLCYLGSDHTQRMMAMCGAFVRNYIDARLVTLADLIELARTNDVPSASVLLVPSFHREAKQGSVTAFQTNLLWQVLESRMITERLTVIGVQSLALLKNDYGAHFADLVSSHYEVIS